LFIPNYYEAFSQSLRQNGNYIYLHSTTNKH
jgi:hypothetical protein